MKERAHFGDLDADGSFWVQRIKKVRYGVLEQIADSWVHDNEPSGSITFAELPQ
jgi:hypothetical protein